MATAKLLYQNRIPYINKNGFKRIGLKYQKKMHGRDLTGLKNHLLMSGREVNKIREHYRTSNIEQIIEDLWKSYEIGNSFADVNANLFARICQYFGIEVLFFRYSDVQIKKVFLKEWTEISHDIERFNHLYNSAISSRRVEEINPNDPKLSTILVPL